MRTLLLALAFLASFVPASLSQADVSTTRAANPTAVSSSVSITRVSSTELAVRTPIKNAPSACTVAEWRFQKNAVTNGWFITNLTARNLCGGAADLTLTEPTSVWEYVVGIFDASEGGYPVGYGLYGGAHNNEAATGPPSIKVDGREIGVESGSGASIIISQTLDTKKPAYGGGGAGIAAGTVIGSSTLTHIISRAGIVIEHSHTVTTAGLSYRTASAGNLIINNRIFDRSRAGNGTAVAVAAPGVDTTVETGKTDSYFTYYNTDTGVNPYQIRATLLYGGPVKETAWASVAAPKAWRYSFSSGSTLTPDTGYDKWHWDFVGDTVTAISVVPDTRTGRTLYEVTYGPAEGTFFDPMRFVPLELRDAVAANDDLYEVAA